MSTLPPPIEKKFEPETLESKIYTLIENYSEYIPIKNDRLRLSFYLFNFLEGHGDPPDKSLFYSKIKINKIEQNNLIKLIEKDIAHISKLESNAK